MLRTIRPKSCILKAKKAPSLKSWTNELDVTSTLDCLRPEALFVVRFLQGIYRVSSHPKGLGQFQGAVIKGGCNFGSFNEADITERAGNNDHVPHWQFKTCFAGRFFLYN